MENFLAIFGRFAPLLGFKGSRSYWEKRYRMGGNSGAGSRGENAVYKGQVLNRFIREHDVRSLIEFGCGDGYQLGLIETPDYTGVDVSDTVIARCRKLYEGDAGKKFLLLDAYKGETAHLALSLDVIFHLVEDTVYDQYLDRLFSAAERFVIVYSTSSDLASTGTAHVRHRDCAADIEARFLGFARMHEIEASLPPPVRFDRGLPTRFFLYSRSA